MKPLIIVHFSRLESGVFGLREGDIQAAYSAPSIGGDCKSAIRIFRHDGKLWTNGGMSWNVTFCEAFCFQLIPVENYTGPETAEFSYEGKTVIVTGRKYRLGPKTEFRSADRSVVEWRDDLRRKYKLGGYFTSGKTFHQVVRETAEKEIWDIPSQTFKPISGNIVEAIKLELATPDFDKAATPPITEPEKVQLQLLPDNIIHLPKPVVPLWRQRLSKTSLPRNPGFSRP
jgi:hypothetical protein